MNHRWTLLLCLWFVPIGLTAEAIAATSTTPTIRSKLAGKVMNCRAAVQYALKNNPKMRVMQASIRVAMQRLRGTQIFPTNPELEGVGKIKAKPDGPETKVDPYKVELELTWKMPIGGRWTRLQKLARATLERVKEEISAQRLTLILKVQKSCYQTLVARQKFELYQRLISFYQRVFTIVKRRKGTGAATILDLNLAKVELLQNRASMILARNEWQVEQQKLAMLMGWNRRTQPSIKDVIRGPFQALPTLQQMRTRASQHYLLRVIRRRIKEVQRTLYWAQAKAIPDMKFKLFYSFEDGFNHTMGAGLSMPIPMLWRNQTKIWTTRAKVRELRFKKRALAFQIQQRIQQTYLQFSAASRVFQLYEKQLLPTFKQQLQLRIRAFQLGSFSILRVLSAQQSQNKALLKRIDALKHKLKSYISLQFAIGYLLPP